MRLKPLISCWGLVAMIAGALPSMTMPNDSDAAAGTLSKGKQLYGRYCAGCHGPEGKGDGYKLLGPDPANLTRPAIKGQSDAALLDTIHEGKTNMPSWKIQLSDEGSRAVLAYVRTLAK